MRAWRAQLYILKDIIPSFFLGILVFILVLLLFQALRLTEFVLVQGVDLTTVSHIVYYMIQSFLPAILPMSCLFAVLMTYTRLSADSELIALRAIGLNMKHIGTPALIFGILTSIVTLYTVMVAGPQGNREFEVIITKMARQKSHTRIQEGSFSKGFYDMVIYTQKYNSKKGLLEKVFIFDENKGGTPTTIIADRGQILQSNKFGDVQTILRLIDGDIHQPKGSNYTKINFETYDIFASSEVSLRNVKLSPPSLSFSELQSELKTRPGPKPPETSDWNTKHTWKKQTKRYRSIQAEIQKRFAIGILPFIFCLMGLGLGAVTNRRSGGGNSFVTSMMIIIAFWIMYITGENAVKDGKINAIAGIWYTNLVFLLFALHKVRKVWN